MNILCQRNFKGHVIICDPIYIVSDKPDTTNCPKIEQYVPIDVTQEMLKDDTINMLYRYGMEDYYYDYDNWNKEVQTDWDKCEYGNKLENVGISNYITHSMKYDYGTYGVYSNDGVFKGQFCSDSGLVCVCLLDDILRYNEDFDNFLTMTYGVTLIPNFNGDIAFISKGDHFMNTSDICIVGSGNLNFHTQQIGF